MFESKLKLIIVLIVFGHDNKNNDYTKNVNDNNNMVTYNNIDKQ